MDLSALYSIFCDVFARVPYSVRVVLLVVAVLWLIRRVEALLLPRPPHRSDAARYDRDRRTIQVNGVATTELRWSTAHTPGSRTNGFADLPEGKSMAADRSNSDHDPGSVHRAPLLVCVIPGNPGSMRFYVGFMRRLFRALRKAYPDRAVEVCGIEHAAHTTDVHRTRTLHFTSDHSGAVLSCADCLPPSPVDCVWPQTGCSPSRSSVWRIRSGLRPRTCTAACPLCPPTRASS
jgi:hypothetical protein